MQRRSASPRPGSARRLAACVGAAGRGPGTRAAAGRDPQLLVARRVRALRLPLLRRARARAAAARAAEARRGRPRGRRCGSAAPSAGSWCTRCSSGSTFADPCRRAPEAIIEAAERAGLAEAALEDRRARRSVRRQRAVRAARPGHGRPPRGALRVPARRRRADDRRIRRARARAGRRLLVVDYKSDRLAGADPAELVARAVRDPAADLRARRAAHRRRCRSRSCTSSWRLPDGPVTGPSRRATARLERELASLAGGVLESRVRRHRRAAAALCRGCPAEGGLCSWPLELTRREAPDRLF